jgi:hypothetical protein
MLPVCHRLRQHSELYRLAVVCVLGGALDAKGMRNKEDRRRAIFERAHSIAMRVWKKVVHSPSGSR